MGCGCGCGRIESLCWSFLFIIPHPINHMQLYMICTMNVNILSGEYDTNSIHHPTTHSPYFFVLCRDNRKPVKEFVNSKSNQKLLHAVITKPCSEDIQRLLLFRGGKSAQKSTRHDFELILMCS